MMSFKTGFETHQDKIIQCLIELHTEGHLMDKSELERLLPVVYNRVLPPIAKVFFKQKDFVSGCLDNEDILLRGVNKMKRRTFIKVLK